MDPPKTKYLAEVILSYAFEAVANLLALVECRVIAFSSTRILHEDELQTKWHYFDIGRGEIYKHNFISLLLLSLLTSWVL